MNWFTRKTCLEVVTQSLINLSSGWFGVVFIVPGIFGVSSTVEYIWLLIQNVPFGIVSLIIAAILLERIKLYDS